MRYAQGVHAADNAVGHFGQNLRRGHGHDHGKLLATVAGGKSAMRQTQVIGVAHAGLNGLCHLAQTVVTTLVTIVVVVFFEVVDVEHQQPVRPAKGLRF